LTAESDPLGGIPSTRPYNVRSQSGLSSAYDRDDRPGPLSQHDRSLSSLNGTQLEPEHGRDRLHLLEAVDSELIEGFDRERLPRAMTIGAVDVPEAYRVAETIEDLAVTLRDRNEHCSRAFRIEERPVPLEKPSSPGQALAVGLASQRARWKLDGRGCRRRTRGPGCCFGQGGERLMTLDGTEMGPQKSRDRLDSAEAISVKLILLLLRGSHCPRVYRTGL
jgi:hypothetical protein